VLEYVDNETQQTHQIDSFNAGNRNHHSEEAIFAILENQKKNYRPVRLFSDRQPCSQCMAAIKTIIDTKARGHDLAIYYISPYPPGNQGLIRAWWQ
jgi:hypothetical protein